MNRLHWFAYLSLGATVGIGAHVFSKYDNIWLAATAVLTAAIVLTILPIAQAFLNQVKPDAAPVWIDEAINFGSEADRVKAHYARMKGTLVYWKNEAAAHHRLDSARVFWSLVSAVLLPVLVQLYKASEVWATVFHDSAYNLDRPNRSIGLHTEIRTAIPRDAPAGIGLL